MGGHSRSSLHQHPQADHVRTHVPENADASPQAGMGSAMEKRTCMRTKGDAESEVSLISRSKDGEML
ncbi:hypothetical protein D9C73_003681 [Collichthys lucidus]|uniref:Uncharacterized protein n=1 Tax=Collichthys lucidus TaxID=240159 RepID=A0A4U5U986_COLLU|nr:hypothetical protein D9C73_003681 [Collichthys lucidus]